MAQCGEAFWVFIRLLRNGNGARLHPDIRVAHPRLTGSAISTQKTRLYSFGKGYVVGMACREMSALPGAYWIVRTIGRAVCDALLSSIPRTSAGMARQAAAVFVLKGLWAGMKNISPEGLTQR